MLVYSYTGTADATQLWRQRSDILILKNLSKNFTFLGKFCIWYMPTFFFAFENFNTHEAESEINVRVTMKRFNIYVQTIDNFNICAFYTVLLLEPINFG